MVCKFFPRPVSVTSDTVGRGPSRVLGTLERRGAKGKGDDLVRRGILTRRILVNRSSLGEGCPERARGL